MSNTSGTRFVRTTLVLSVAIALMAAFAIAGVSAQASDERDFFGTVISVDGEVLVISTKDGVEEILTTEDTKVRLPLKRDAVLADLVEGDLVAVSLEESDGVLVADKIVLIPGKTRHRHVPGEITAIDVAAGTDTQITIQPPAEEAAPVTFVIDADTTVRFREGVTELVIGNFVVVLVARDPVTGELLPEAIEVHVVEREPVPEPKGARIEAEAANTADIQGVFQGLDDAGNWIVGDTTIAVNADTEIETAVATGQLIKVEALILPDGSLLALEIDTADGGRKVAGSTRLEGIFEGTDEQGNWIVSGTTVFVGPGADTDGLPAIGQRVTVKAILQEGGILVAREIENKGGSRREDDAREVKLRGTFLEIDSDGNWIINGTKIAVDPLTRLKGTPVVGQRIEVKAILLGDGSLLALKIEGKGKDPDKAKTEAEIRGIVDAIGDESITVDGIIIAISALTELEGDIQPGDYAEVEALILPGGSLLAREVKGFGLIALGDDLGRSKAGIEGTITQVNQDGSLVVNGLTIAISPLSRIRGDITEGAFVKIEGVLLPDGSLLAEEIKGEGRRATSSRSEVKVKGPLEAVNRDQDNNIVSIVINGLTITLDPLTRVEGTLVEGIFVEVKGIISNGNFLAGKIEISEVEEAAGVPETRIEGVIEAVETDAEGRLIAITVNGVEVDVSDADIEGDLVVGAEVEIRATLIQGAIKASEVDVEEPTLRAGEDDAGAFELEGTVGAIGLDGDGNIISVVVDGRTVVVSPLTRVRGTVEVGGRVTVEGVIRVGLYLATRIKADESDSDDVSGVSDQGTSESERPSGNDESGSGLDRQGDERRFEGVVASFTSTELVLEDGTSLVINRDTDIDGTLLEGVEVKVRATSSGSSLIAIRIDVQ